MRLLVRRQINAAGKTFPVGSEITIAQLGPNYRSFLSSHYVEWMPVPDSASLPRPRDMAPPAPPPPPPPRPNKASIVYDADAVVSWRLSLQAMTRVCNGDAKRAEDLLLSIPEGRQLYMTATRIACKEEARRRDVWSVSPDQVRL
jgi:hypothetical protein